MGIHAQLDTLTQHGDTMHEITLTETRVNNYGYPYRAECTCGWQSAPHTNKHAAKAMGDLHLSAVVTALGVK